MRIQERLKALREGETAGPVREAVQKQSEPGKQQVLESVRKIMALRTDTTAAVQSMKLHSDAAENTRIMAEEKRKQELRTKMLAEAEHSARRNAAVAMHWADLFTIDVPQVVPPV
jgi:dynein regulatry complex protein 1